MEFIKRNKKLLSIFLILLFFLVGLTSYLLSGPPIKDFPDLTSNQELTSQEYLEDFDYLCETLEAYYPFFGIFKEKHGYDLNWQWLKEYYRKEIEKTTSDYGFYMKVQNFLSELNNDHTQIIPENSDIEYYYILYRDYPRIDFRSDIADLYERPVVQNRYRITNESVAEIQDYLDNSTYHDSGSKNYSLGDLIEGEVAYLHIKSMVTPDLNRASFEEEYNSIMAYLQKVKDYPALVIDIRGNQGGNSGYWQTFLLRKIISQPYENTEYVFIKEGPLLDKYRISHFLRTVMELTSIFPKKPMTI